MRTPAIIACLILALAWAALGQRGPGPRAGRPMAMGTAVDRWNRMSPEQRERALQKLPPERQKQIRERLRQFNSLPEEEQQRLRERYEHFSKLPPERQQLVRQQMRAFQQLPEDRRHAVRREFVRLGGLPESERRARIDSEDFRNRFSPSEQQILHDLSDNMPPPAKQR